MLQTAASTADCCLDSRRLQYTTHAASTCQTRQHDMSAQSAANDRGSRMLAALPRAHTHAHTHAHKRCTGQRDARYCEYRRPRVTRGWRPRVMPCHGRPCLDAGLEAVSRCGAGGRVSMRGYHVTMSLRPCLAAPCHCGAPAVRGCETCTGQTLMRVSISVCSCERCTGQARSGRCCDSQATPGYVITCMFIQSGDPRERDDMHVYTVRRPPGT
jgi:hypothetical protein